MAFRKEHHDIQMLYHLSQLEKLSLRSPSKEPLKGFEQGNNRNIFAVIKGHSGLRLGKRPKQRATKAVRTQKSNTVVAVQTKNDGNSDMGVEGHRGNKVSIKKDNYQGPSVPY